MFLLGKPSQLSSTYQSYTAGLCNDGDLTKYCHSAAGDSLSWYMIDLQSLFVVQAVTILNRAECFQCAGEYLHNQHKPSQPGNHLGLRAKNIEIQVAQQVEDLSETESLCAEQVEAMALAEEKYFPCTQPLVGRYMRIVLTYDHAILHFSEVTVHGVPLC